jgi:hypothetical protein
LPVTSFHRRDAKDAEKFFNEINEPTLRFSRLGNEKAL